MNLNMHKYQTITGLVIASIVLAVLLVQPTITRAYEPTVTPLEPAIGAGEGLRFSASGFYGHERISIWATDPTQAVITGGYTDADGNGNTHFTFHLPPNAIGGRWSLTIRGDESHALAVAGFDVYGRTPAPTEFQAQSAPPAGPAGTTFAFAAQGFKGHESVSYWLTGPDGQVYESFHKAEETNRDGRVDLTWTSPADALSGRWVVTIQGYDSTRARGIPFWIGDENAPAAPDPTSTSTPAPTASATPVPTLPPAMGPTAAPTMTGPCQPCVPSPGSLPPTGVDEPAPAGGGDALPTPTPTTWAAPSVYSVPAPPAVLPTYEPMWPGAVN